MSLSGIWATLGIAQTRDRAEIRRAYAARLKLVHPEDDPAGFQALRAAYDRALAQAGRAVSAPRVAPEISEPPAVEVAAPPPPPPPESPLQPPVLEADAVSPPPPPPPPAAPEPRVPAAAPPPQVPPPPPPVPTPPSDVSRHQMACTRLGRIVSRSLEIDPTILSDLIDEVLNGAAMEQIGVFIRTEPMVAHLIAANIPRSDPLVAPAIARFGWVVDGRARDPDPAIAAVLARQVDLKYLAGLRSPNNPLRKAAAMLRAPPARGEALRSLVQFGRLNDLRILLDNLRRDHRGLLGNFPPGVIDAWTAYLERPHIASGLFWGAIGLATGIAFLTTTSSTPGPASAGGGDVQPHWTFFLAWPAWTAAVLGLLAAKLFAFDQPRHRWLAEWAPAAPTWVALGWAPAAVGTLALAVVLQLAFPAVIPWWSWIAFAVICAPVVLWAAITGARFPRQNDNWPWPLRQLARSALLVIMWAVLLIKPAVLGAEPQVATAVAACVLVSGLGEQTLANLWNRRLSPGLRKGALALLIVTDVALIAAVADHGQGLIPCPLAAAISLLALLQRPPASTGKTLAFPKIDLGSNPFRGIWVMVVLLGVSSAVLAAGVAVATVLGPWLVLVGTMIGLVQALRRELQGVAPARLTGT